MKKLFTTTALLVTLTAPAFAQPEILWDNNGSLMRTVDDGVRIAVYYVNVRPGLRQTTPPGAIAFEGVRVNGNGGIVGNAFVYTKYCSGKPFAYHVEGTANGVVDVWGPAAVVDPYSCTIVDYYADSENAHRVFPLPVAVVPVPTPVPVPVPPYGGGNHNNGDSELSPDEQADRLRREGQEFCWKYPKRPECRGRETTGSWSH